MLIIALVLFLVAAIFFAFDFLKSGYQNIVSFGLACLAAGLAAYVFYVGDTAGKF